MSDDTGPKKLDWIDFLTPLSFSKTNLIRTADDPEEAERAYKPFMVNRNFSNYHDTILLASEMNISNELDGKLQHDFYFFAISRRKRFAKWAKPEKTADVELIQAVYGYSVRKAIRALKCLRPEDIEQIRQSLDEGGVKKKAKE